MIIIHQGEITRTRIAIIRESNGILSTNFIIFTIRIHLLVFCNSNNKFKNKSDTLYHSNFIAFVMIYKCINHNLWSKESFITHGRG